MAEHPLVMFRTIYDSEEVYYTPVFAFDASMQEGNSDYFDITPSQFFDDGEKNPELVQKALSGLRELDDEDLLMLIGIINRLHKKK